MTNTAQENQTQRQNDYAIDSIFLNRWSPRAFLDKAIPEDVLFSVFEAARWAPSAANMQPWRFIIARNDNDKEKFYSFIKEGNLIWCKKAPVLVAILSQKSLDGNPNRFHSFDAGTAWGYLALQAKMNGLMTHAMGGFDPELAKNVLNIPEDFEVNAIVAIGYQGPADELPEPLKEREHPSGRLSLEELLFEGNFNQPTGK
ncbi:nitroreductase [Pullulanibacillus pueri]|uniref:Nitroreductase n=1 Tax=Pullulanibacillus pueri TaxID=1437324 RepID=A0A8J2ZXA8_9BACL|nr:nitroreductase family protein [Pullulanibacillus pueri]MBM7683084.1 nitroreductase [Pullulanibacillus pueri]GGH84856.1 nitroreductase [Pullulanibacillus pueri]